MKRLMKLVRKDERGFTLMELMIVLVIIGILAAIAVPRFTQTAANAKKIACEANARTLQNAIELYRFDKDTDPTNIDNLAEYVSGGVPTCPSDGKPYEIVDGTAGEKLIKCPTHGTWDGSGLSQQSGGTQPES